jgi:glycine oxidase
VTSGRAADVAIVGGGVIGLALARELAGRGRRVVVLERGETAQEASWAAAGLLSAQSDVGVPGAFFDLAIESRALYPAWASDLEAETGEAVGYRATGLVRCAFDAGESEALRGFLWQRERGLPLEWWDAPVLAARFGGALSPDVRSGLFFPEEGVVDPRKLTRARGVSVRVRGVEVRSRTAARRFWIEDGRCLGVETEGGRLAADAVVDAAGAWAAFDRELPFAVPVEPVRGQIVELDLGGSAPDTVVHSEAVYLAPQGGGRVLVGSTLERAGFARVVTAGALGALLESAARLWPAVRTARFVTAWAGLRPGTPDGLPILGDCGIRGLYFAAGHFRNGILLAPVTARKIADLLTGGAASPDLASFRVGRFRSGRAGPSPVSGPGVFR